MDRILIILKKENGPRASSGPALGLNTIIFKHVYWYMQQTQVSVYRTIGPLVNFYVEVCFLSHLLIAGCDIGVQISVRPFVCSCVRSFVRPSTFTSKFGFSTSEVAVSLKACIVIVPDIPFKHAPQPGALDLYFTVH